MIVCAFYISMPTGLDTSTDVHLYGLFTYVFMMPCFLDVSYRYIYIVSVMILILGRTVQSIVKSIYQTQDMPGGLQENEVFGRINLGEVIRSMETRESCGASHHPGD